MKESIYNKMTNAEREVADLLKEMGIKWSYEPPVFLWDEDKRPRIWAPDFFLSSYGIYVEVCGSKNFDYDYRKTIYQKNGYNVIFLHLCKTSNKWKNHFLHYLKLFTRYRNSKLNEIIRVEN